MRIVGINLICVRSNQLSGIGHVAKRYFMEMERFDLSEFHFIIYKQKSIDLSIFCIPNNANYEIVNVPDVGGGFKLALFEQTLFYFYMKKCDVMWSPNYSSPWFGRRKKIVSILDIYPIVDKKTYGFWKRICTKVLNSINAWAADTIVTISEYSKKDLIEELGVKPEKICLLYCFLSSKEIEFINNVKPADSITVDNVLEPLKKPYFLAVSVIKPIKNYEGLIMAFAKFKKLHQEYSLYIVGSKGWRYKKVFELVDELNLSDSVHFTGYISSDDINTLYANCRATVLPSFYEGFGYTPLEGFYRGKITIASGVSSIPEVVGDAGVYIDPYDIDSIVTGLDKATGEISEYENNIEKQIEKFSAQRITNNFLSVLRN